MSSFYNSVGPRGSQPGIPNSKDNNLDQGSQGFAFKPLGVKTVSRNTLSPISLVHTVEHNLVEVFLIYLRTSAWCTRAMWPVAVVV